LTKEIGHGRMSEFPIDNQAKFQITKADEPHAGQQKSMPSGAKNKSVEKIKNRGKPKNEKAARETKKRLPEGRDARPIRIDGDE